MKFAEITEYEECENTRHIMQSSDRVGGSFHLTDSLGQINHCLNIQILTCNNFCYFMVYFFVTRLTFELLRMVEKTEQSTFDFTPKNTAGVTQFNAVITRPEK